MVPTGVCQLRPFAPAGADNATKPCSTACSTLADHKVVFPIPGSPSTAWTAQAPHAEAGKSLTV
jgi:hypothetical protein